MFLFNFFKKHLSSTLIMHLITFPYHFLSDYTRGILGLCLTKIIVFSKSIGYIPHPPILKTI